MIKISPPHHYRAKYYEDAIVTSGKYLNFTTPFPDDSYYIATFGNFPFIVTAKHPTGVMLYFEGEPRIFLFYSGVVDTTK